MADPDLIRLVARRTGIGLKLLSKDTRISAVLAALRPAFPEAVLKGGTALNRVYLGDAGRGRLSEDIDLDIPGNPSPDGLARRMPRMEGFDIDRPRILHRTVRFDCRFVNDFGESDKLRIEFRREARPYVGVREELVRSPFIETATSLFRVYSLEDLMAQKLLALHDRTEGKDLYDLYHAFEIRPDQKRLDKALRLELRYYDILQNKFRASVLASLKRAARDVWYIRSSTNHYIPAGRRPDWGILIRTLSIAVGKALGEVDQ